MYSYLWDTTLEARHLRQVCNFRWPDLCSFRWPLTDDDVTAATVACSRLAAKRLPARDPWIGSDPAGGRACENTHAPTPPRPHAITRASAGGVAPLHADAAPCGIVGRAAPRATISDHGG